MLQHIAHIGQVVSPRLRVVFQLIRPQEWRDAMLCTVDIMCIQAILLKGVCLIYKTSYCLQITVSIAEQYNVKASSPEQYMQTAS
jgi:hypothetical protein